MYAIAVIGDILSFVPVLNIVSGAITTMLLWIVGEETGVNIFSNSMIGGTLLTILIEEAPGLAMVPAFTARVYFAKKQVRESEGQA